MIIHINGSAGVGKFTIGSALAELIGARLVDNHSIYNVAFALTDFRSEAFYDTVRAVRDIAYRRIAELPATVPVILTNWFWSDSDWANENWDEIIWLARERGSALYIVVLTCSPEENARRIQSSDRAARRKPRDPAMIANPGGRQLLNRDGDHLLRLDVSDLSAEAAAQNIAQWINENSGL